MASGIFYFMDYVSNLSRVIHKLDHRSTIIYLCVS